MKLLFINSYYYPAVGGGAEIVLRDQVAAFSARGHEVAVACTSANAALTVDEVDGVSVYRVPIANEFWPLSPGPRSLGAKLRWHLRDRNNRQMRTRLREVLDSVRPDLAICHNLSGWSISVWDELNELDVPIVQVLHDAYLRCPKSTMFHSGRACSRPCPPCFLLRCGHRTASGSVRRVIGVSDYILRSFTDAGYFTSARKDVIQNCRKISGAPRRTRANSSFRFGFMGALVEAKGLYWLIEQFNSLDGDATLIIAGKGEPEVEEALRDLASSSKISFAGYVDPAAFLSSVDALIVPSIWPDTFPGVAYEACAAHLPVIASNVGGLPEIIREGVNGLLCDPLEPDSLGAALTMLSTRPDLYATLAANARQSVSHLLDHERMLTRYESVFESTLSA